MFNEDVQPSSPRITSIGSDVWIGAMANILAGVTVGDGAVIGANTLVNKDVPPYAVVVGNPARIIKYRFDEQIVSRLMKLHWWDWPRNVIKENVELLTGDLTREKLSMMENVLEKAIVKNHASEFGY